MTVKRLALLLLLLAAACGGSGTRHAPAPATVTPPPEPETAPSRPEPVFDLRGVTVADFDVCSCPCGTKRKVSTDGTQRIVCYEDCEGREKPANCRGATDPVEPDPAPAELEQCEDAGHYIGFGEWAKDAIPPTPRHLWAGRIPRYFDRATRQSEALRLMWNRHDRRPTDGAMCFPIYLAATRRLAESFKPGVLEAQIGAFVRQVNRATVTADDEDMQEGWGTDFIPELIQYIGVDRHYCQNFEARGVHGALSRLCITADLLKEPEIYAVAIPAQQRTEHAVDPEHGAFALPHEILHHLGFSHGGNDEANYERAWDAEDPALGDRGIGYHAPGYVPDQVGECIHDGRKARLYAYDRHRYISLEDLQRVRILFFDWLRAKRELDNPDGSRRAWHEHDKHCGPRRPREP